MVLLGEEAQVKAQFGCLEIVLILMKDRCTVCMECSIFSEINLAHPIELLNHVCHMESRFNLFGDSVSLGARLVDCLRIMHHRLRNHYGSTR